MANELSYTNYGTNNLVSSLSRYVARNVVLYGNEKKAAFAVNNKKNIGIGPDDRFFEITKETEFRPDLVSGQIYGIPDLWWRIMEINRMKDIMEFRAGRNIRVPNNFLM